MANEISASATLTVSKNGVTTSQSASQAFDQTGNTTYEAVVSVSTTAAAISFGAISGAPSAVLLRNLDSTNFLKYGPSNPPTEFTLRPGRVALFEPASATQYWKADTASVKALIKAVES